MSADFEEYAAKNIRSGVTQRVLRMICARTKSQNAVRVAQTEIAEALGISASQVSRAFRELAEHGVLVKMREDDCAPLDWYLSPAVGFRGSGKGQSYMYQRLAREGQVVLPFDAARRQKLKALAEA